MFRQIIQILMVLAIANPLCCCSADWLMGDAAVPEQVSTCCGGGPAHAPDEGPVKQEHDPENCPHQASKDYQSGSSPADVKLAQFDLTVHPVLFVLFEVYEARLQVASVSKLNESTISAAEAPSFSQEYCVYRI